MTYHTNSARYGKGPWRFYTNTHLYPGLVAQLLHPRVNHGKELDGVAALVGPSEVRTKVQLALCDVVVVLEQVSVPQLERKKKTPAPHPQKKRKKKK